MFLSVWNYLRGYVILEVSGFSVERFLNLCAYKNIYLWDINRTDKGINVKVSIKGFKMLKPCAKKTRCHIKIIDREGVPFLVHKYRKRKVLVAGTLFFIATLYFLSSFIWSIEIIGNERINKQNIIDYSIELGLKPGVYKGNLNLRELEQSFMKKFNDISWIAISSAGTKIKVELKETIAKTEMIDTKTPCDIVANKNGIIVSIATNIGTPKVKAKDVVEKGDILVSGQLVIGEEGSQRIEYVHAKAEVKAKLWYEFNLEEDIKYNEKIYTGKTKKSYTVDVLNKKFNILNTSIPYSSYDKMSNVKQLNFGGDFTLPLSIITHEYSEYLLYEKTRSADEIKEAINLKLNDILKEQLDEHIQILDRSINYQTEGNKVKANIIITTIERIDTEVQIEGSNANGTNGESN